MKDPELKEKLLGISKKYAEMALTEAKVDLVSKYMSIAERALSMANKLRDRVVPEIDPVFRFGTYIVKPMPRSVVYEKYLEFCAALQVDPLPRNKFYGKLRGIGFTDKSKNDNEYFLPPGNPSRGRFKPEVTLDDYIEQLKSI